MNVLVIGSDNKILEKGSEVQNRMKEYGTLADRIDIIIYNGKYWQRGEDIIKVASNVFAHPRSFRGLIALFSTARLSFLLNHKIDLISSQDPFILGFIAWRLSKWLRVPLQLQVHTDFLSPYFRRESIYNRFKVIIAKLLLKRADGIRVVSEKIKRSIKKNIKKTVEPSVLPIWTDARSIHDAEIKIDLIKKYPQFDIILLMASRLTVEKNIELAIEAIAGISKNHGKVGLIIVGEGPLKKNYELRITNYKLKDNVIIESWSDDLPSYYKTSDLFLLTSNYEGYGRTIIESLSSGTPVLTTDVGCAEEVIENEKNGFIIPVANKRKLIEYLTKFIENEEFKDVLRVGATKWYKETQFQTKEEYLRLYKKGWEECLSS